MVLGVGGGVLAGLFIYGLLGGLIGILLYKRKILKLPNYKISIFIGYFVFIFFLFILPAFFVYTYDITKFFLFGLTLLHITINLIIHSFFEKKKITNSLYWSFILSYLFGCFVLSIFGIILFLGNALPIFF